MQICVEEKTNEIPVAFALLPFLPVAGRVYTADALHTHPPFFQRIQALHGHTVLMVKGNQPTLQEHLVTYFADPLASFEQACTIDLQRGRKEVRSLKVTAALNEYLQQDWPGVAQVAQLTRTVTVSKTAETTTEVVYLITTLTREQASPERLLELVRGHWCIGATRFAETNEQFGDGEQGGESSLTTDRVTWGAIPHPLGERENAAPSR